MTSDIVIQPAREDALFSEVVNEIILEPVNTITLNKAIGLVRATMEEHKIASDQLCANFDPDGNSILYIHNYRRQRSGSPLQVKLFLSSSALIGSPIMKVTPELECAWPCRSVYEESWL